MARVEQVTADIEADWNRRFGDDGPPVFADQTVPTALATMARLIGELAADLSVLAHLNRRMVGVYRADHPDTAR